MNFITAVAMSLVASFFPNEEINANPAQIPFGDICAPVAAFIQQATGFEVPEAFVAETHSEELRGTAILLASEDRTAYSLLFQPDENNPRNLACVVEVNSTEPFEVTPEERDASL